MFSCRNKKKYQYLSVEKKYLIWSYALIRVSQWFFTCQLKYLQMCRVKIQISLHIRAVWSESSLATFWKANDANFLHTDNKDSNQTVQMGRLIWVFVRHTCQKVLFLKLQLIYSLPCNLTMIGILMSSFSPASTIPWAMTSHLIIPPKMFTRIECTYKCKIYIKCPQISNPCLFVLRFYGPVNPMGSCRARSVYLTTRLLGRLSPLSNLSDSFVRMVQHKTLDQYLKCGQV